jgi:integrase
MPNVLLFPAIPETSAAMVRADCVDAGVEAENHKGKLGLHSLRHTCGSFLLDQGVLPLEVMEVMRHQDYKLTMQRYGHLLAGRKQQAVNRLPRFARDQYKVETA